MTTFIRKGVGRGSFPSKIWSIIIPRNEAELAGLGFTDLLADIL